MKLRKRWCGKNTQVSNQPTPFVGWIWISTRSLSIQCCCGAFWREIILAQEKNNLLYLLIFQSPFLPFFLLSLLSFFPRSSRVVVMVNRCHGERASKTRVTPGTFYQSFYYLSKSCQKELEKQIRAPDHIWSNSRWRLIQTAKTKCSESKLVNWQMTYMIFWIMFNVIWFREFCGWLSYLEYEQ